MNMNRFMNVLMTMAASFMATIIFLIVIPIMMSTQDTVKLQNLDYAINYWGDYGYVAVATPTGGLTVTGDLTVDGDIDTTIPANEILYTDASGVITGSSNLTYNATGNFIESPTGRSATYVIAASDAPAHVKAQADVVCDGTADNVEIQAAIDAGYKVLLSQGTFTISGQINNGTQISLNIEGAGMGGGRNNAPGGQITLITAANGINTDLIGLNNVASIVRLANFRINGNSVNQASGSGINSQAWFNILENIWVSDTKEYGIELSGDGAIPCAGIGINVWVDHANLSGIYHSNNASDWEWINVKSFQNTQHGLQIVNGSAIKITGGDIYLNTLSGISIYGTGMRSIKVSKVSLDQNSVYGLHIFNTADDPTTIYDLIVESNYFGSNTIGSVCIEKAIGELLIESNYFDDASAIICDADSGSINWQVINNKIMNSWGNALYSTAVIRNNTGYIAPSELRTASGSLTAGNANAIAFAWHNPEAQDIYIKKVVVTVTTTGGTAGAGLQVGIADDAVGTNLGAEFADTFDLNTAAVYDSTYATDNGTQVKWVFCQDSASATDAWVVGKILTENAASLVGSYYVEYVGK